MTDNKTARHSPDNKRIDVNDPNEVRHWSESLGITPEKLKELVSRVGTLVEKVRTASKS